jgi:quercetin dioxygenase-like cupin family protein
MEGGLVAAHTYLRTHTLSAEHLLLDLGGAAVDLRAMEDDFQDRRAVTLVRESGMNVVLVALKPGAVLREHAAPGPATVQVLDGHVRVKIGDEQLDVPADRLLAFDAGVRHEVEAVEDSTLLLTLSGGE